MKYAAIALIAALSLTACSQHTSEPSVSVLPDVPEYSEETQTRAATEMILWCEKMPTVCDVLIPDYKVMRDQVRAAKKILSN